MICFRQVVSPLWQLGLEPVGRVFRIARLCFIGKKLGNVVIRLVSSTSELGLRKRHDITRYHFDLKGQERDYLLLLLLFSFIRIPTC